jgi:transcription-repair coupling factor (superfamily II helicase)
MINNTCPMNRLICGDVGFGKTEVATRAAYRSVLSHKQVAYLAPTRVLAMQIAKNLQSRMPTAK